jgi:sacsin
MRNVYIDCGYARGQSLNLFRTTKEYKNDFVVYAFDPSKVHKSRGGFTYFQKAVWIYDGELDFYVSSRRNGKANGVFHNPLAIDEKIVKVPCIDFSKWILETFSKEDFIVLKMDIEGAEKEVLEKMIKDGSIDFIKIAYVEPHRKLDNDPVWKQIKGFLSHKKDLDYRTAIEWVFNKYKKQEGKL